ncbi:TolB family protein [Dyadobacter pollutisoli]|jgi:hypothetical protein|uniref:Biopolymer transporter Tol n=1 Tax=Dyadobacter pollutisoli TaxID=2910158 RepID=A0A9E8NF44_9BACT|nr:hypothetical protein [Dyadobacter pollutisoli]WAC14813.1 hypothetical protein ON006_12780 [Dyadobacter pollutisoli]
MKKFLAIALLLQSCWPIELGKRKDGDFLDEVVRLDEFNSEFDDYNSNLPYNKSGHTFLTFSSKRDRKSVFNLVNFQAQFTYNKRLNLEIYKPNGVQYDRFSDRGALEGMINRANGNFNVFGPKTLLLGDDIQGNISERNFFLFYADDSEGNMQIKYYWNNNKGIEGPYNFDILNSAADDGYPSFSYQGDKIFFSSNRDGNFDIYELSIPRAENEQVTPENLLHPKSYKIRKVEELSSPYDDKCPYFHDGTMVFVSDRPGGIGGQDIYYATYENEKWGVPINAGSRVNTASNEYRPILPKTNNFNYRLMIFSSDRPGGKGGYDLYMTGLTKKW